MSKPLSALIVEDNEQDATLLVRELRRGGYDLSFDRVETPDAMCAALDKRTWDIVLSDYSMPRFSAPAALALVRERNLDLPFIIISGTIGEDTAVESLRAGAHDFIVKGSLARLLPAIGPAYDPVEQSGVRLRAAERVHGRSACRLAASFDGKDRRVRGAAA
jgi:DNA-binding NtrC family response regulator